MVSNSKVESAFAALDLELEILTKAQQQLVIGYNGGSSSGGDSSGGISKEEKSLRDMWGEGAGGAYSGNFVVGSGVNVDKFKSALKELVKTRSGGSRAISRRSRPGRKAFMNVRYICFVIMIFFFPEVVFPQAANPPKFQRVDRHCKCPEFIWKGGRFEIIPEPDPKNEIEVRLSSHTFGSARIVIVLSMRNDSVQGFFYIQRTPLTDRVRPDSAKKIAIWEMHPWKKFAITSPELNAVFAEMISHNLLRLPDQKTLMNGEPFSSKYSITYKDHDRLGSYRFDYAVDMVESHPEVPEFRDYVAILKLFNKLTIDYENIGLASDD